LIKEGRLLPSPVMNSMPERNRSDRRPVDRLFLLAIVAYALLALGFIGYFVWRLFADG